MHQIHRAIVSVGVLLGACSSHAPASAPMQPAASGTSPVVAAGSSSTSAGRSAGTITADPASGGAGVSSAAAGMRAPLTGASGTSGVSAAPAAGKPAAEGGGGAQPTAGSHEPSGPSTGVGLFPPVTGFTGNGPYTAMTLTATGPNGMYTVWLPTEPAPEGAKNPIVGWMSGGATTPDGYPLLPHLATHGFVVVASNTAPGIGDEVNLGKEIIAGIDWAIAENARDGSPLFGRLDTTKLASMGYSMGSLATFTIANDPRLTTTVHISGGNMAPERIMNLHAPAAFLCGIPGDDSCNILSTDCDIAAANCDTDFNNATTPVFYANFSGGHLGILTPPLQDQIGAEATAWLRWQLMGDSTIKRRFVGTDCSVCKDMNWKVKQKDLQ